MSIYLSSAVVARLFCFGSATLAFPAVGVGTVDAQDQVLVSEVQVRNGSTLRDGDGDTPDWIELFNAGDTEVPMVEWTLVKDGVVRWSFPEVTMAPRSHVIVFASEKDRATPGKPLHTNFKLSIGDSLALLRPGGRVVWSVDALPETPADASWGTHLHAEETPLIGRETPYRWMALGEEGAGEMDWQAPDFDDSEWTEGSGGIGFSTSAPGLTVETHRTFGNATYEQFGNITTDLRLLINRPGLIEPFGASRITVFDFADSESDPEIGRYPGGSKRLPETGGTIYRASGQIAIPTEGPWTFLVGSADADAAYIVNVGSEKFSTFDGFFGPVPIDSKPGFFGFSERAHTLNLVAGVHPITIWFTQSTPKPLEMSVSAGELTEIDEGFKLLGADGGPTLKTSPDPALEALITTGIGPAQRAALRSTFRLPAGLGTTTKLVFRGRYADSMKCWIDGKLVVDTTALSSSVRPAALALKESEWEFSLPDSDRESHVLAIESAAAKGNDLLSLLSFRLFLRKDIGRENAYFAVATPGERNGNPAKGVASVPTAKPGRGVFTTPIDVSLSSSAPGYQLIYTTDGSEPTAENGTLYEGPISVPSTKVIRSRNIAAGLLPSEIVSHTYLFPRSQAGQDGAGLPESWGFTPADYDFGTRDPGSPAEDLNVALSAIPSMSVTLPSTDLFGADGLMANPDYRGAASALRASVEWIWPGGQNFQDDGTVRIKGEASRTPDFIKHGLRLDFPDRTGGPLRRPVFAQSSRSRFNTLMLHGSFVDNTITLREKAQFIRDLWVRDTLRSMGWPSPHGDYFHLYLNGLYWGLYHAGERADAQWCSTYLGGTPEEWDVVDDFGTIDGDNSEWLRLLGFLQGAEPNAHNYREVVSQFDIPAFIDYMLANIYAVNTDWPGHNWYAARRKDGGLWRFITWDAEYSFDRVTQNLLPEIDQGLGGGPGDLLSFLAKFPEFRQQFADRVRLHFYDNGMLTPQSAEETWMTRAAQIADAVPAEMKRWGDVSPGFPFEVKFAAGMPPSLFRIGEGASLPVTAEDWRKELDRLHRDWFPHRSKILLRQLRAVGLYPDVTPPAILPKGGFVPAGTAIEIANQGYDAELYYTLDGSDPANADGTRSSSAIRYTGPLTISGPTQIKVRGFYEGEASALTQASFEVGTDPRALKISEIHFAPPGAGQQVRREYVELLNTGDSPLALGGVTLEDAVDFTFPEPFVLSGKGRVVLVRDRAAFAAAWPRTAIAGEYAGALANEGETLVLRHPVLGVLETINFRPYSPWPENSSGTEVSLQRTTLSRSAALASSWAAAPPTPALEVDPALIDTDGDGLPDEWEKDNGTKLASPDALVDYDGDGFDSRQEFLAGTSPVDASDFLQINSTWVATTGNIHVAINVVPRRSYALQFSQDLATPWVEIYPFDSGDQNQEIVVNIGALAKEGFLRLVLDPRSLDIR